jgi:hypothetical protein
VRPHSIALVTTIYPHESEWSVDLLPEVLFFLEPPPNPNAGIKVERKLRKDDGKMLRDFIILPDRISIDVPGKISSDWSEHVLER